MHAQTTGTLWRTLPGRAPTMGRAFRQGRQDRRHTSVFHPLDAGYLDRSVTMATLRETLKHLFHEVLASGERRWRRGHCEFVQETQVVGVKANCRWFD